MGFSFRLAANYPLYASSHRQNNTYHGLCYTSRGALVGTRNSSMGPPWKIYLTTHRTMSERSYHGATSRSHNPSSHSNFVIRLYVYLFMRKERDVAPRSCVYWWYHGPSDRSLMVDPLILFLVPVIVPQLTQEWSWYCIDVELCHFEPIIRM